LRAQSVDQHVDQRAADTPKAGSRPARQRRVDRSERDTTVGGTAVVSRSRIQNPGDRSERDTTVVRAAVVSLSE
jgi:hypothetical protein